MSDYILDADADLDLDEIWEYIAVDNIDAANQWIAGLPAWVMNTMTSPNMGFHSGQWALTSSSTARSVALLRLSP